MTGTEPSRALPPVTISALDYDRLAWIATAGVYSPRHRPTAELLVSELMRATVIVAQAIPPSVATMHSRLEFCDDVTGEIRRAVLVYPDEADTADRISVLTPIGAALVGLSEGQSITWRASRGVRSLTLLRVLYQPQRMAVLHA